MSLYLKVRSTKFIKTSTLKDVEKGNIEFLKVLDEESDEKYALDAVIKYIKSDCDKAFIAYSHEEIVGILFISFGASKENIVKVKQKINSLPNSKNRELLKFITNYRNLINMYKYELSEHFDNMVFLDFLFLNKKYNRIEVRNFLYESFLNELRLQKIDRFFCVDINKQFKKLYENSNYRILNEQNVEFKSGSKIKLNIQLLEICVDNCKIESKPHEKDDVNLFGDYVTTHNIFHESILCDNPEVKQKLLLIHGTASSHVTWDTVIPALKQHVNLEIIDLPLHGKSNVSPYTKYKWDIFTLSIVVAEFIKQQKWDNLIVWGHSLGGGVTISLKQILSNKIIGLILEDPYNSGALENTRKYITTGIKTMRDAKKDMGKKNISMSRSKWTYALDVYRPLTRNTVSFLMSLFSKNIMNYLDWAYTNNQCPTLVCFGKDDIVINPVLSKRFFTSLDKNYQFEIIKNAGHSLHKDNPSDLLKVVVEFLKKNFND